MRPGVLIVLYLAVVLLPLALAWLRISPPRSLFDELASGAGLLAFAIILVEFILSGRFRSVSGRIGMDVTMRFHQLLARTALALALLHPFLYQAPFAAQRPWDPTRQLTLTGDAIALGSGLLAWVLLPTFILLAIGRDQSSWRYETWRLIHGLGALLIAGLVLHHTLHAGRYSQDPVLAGVWIAMSGVALASMLYVYLVEPLMQRNLPWTVASVRPIALKTWELVLEPQGHGGMQYEAGQFAWINIGNGPFSLYENPFSISSAPSSGARVEFVIKELGDFTRTVGRIEPGTIAHIDGPHGNLVVSRHAEPGIALIAGGVGIAPMLGILRQLHLDGDKRPTVLLYGNRVKEQIVSPAELDDLAQAHGTRLVHVLSEPPPDWTGFTGLVDAGIIREVFHSGDMREWLYILCGPPAMMDVVEETLIEIGVPARQIRSERFRYD
jgi:predicted ferric reductase